jgi:hypothetical protein
VVQGLSIREIQHLHTDFTYFFHTFLTTPGYAEYLIGQILSRRAALRLLGIGSAAFLAWCATSDGTSTIVPTSNPTAAGEATQAPSTAGTALDCVVRPELTIGPYFVDGQLNCSDIRKSQIYEGKPENRGAGPSDARTPVFGKPLNFRVLLTLNKFALGDVLEDAAQRYRRPGRRLEQGLLLRDFP